MTAPRPKRRKLSQFPCPDGYDTFSYKCVDSGCPYEPPDGCALRPIYKQAIADNRCARLLRVFEKRLFLSTIWAINSMVRRLTQHHTRSIPPESAGWGRRQKQMYRMRGYIRAALRDAGLMEE